MVRALVALDTDERSSPKPDEHSSPRLDARFSQGFTPKNKVGLLPLARGARRVK
uniref:Uncharacterized protein n=1 Tax=Arundo donax TaxID=35708 RepID=A0A0A8Y3T1_ARUDO